MRRSVRAFSIPLLAALGACGGEKPPAEDPLPRLETVSALAARECACRMAGRDSSVLAKEFNRLIARVDAHAFGTASEPLSYQSVCLHKLGEKACFLIQVDVVASPGDFACTGSQTDELEALYARAFPPGARSASAANAALLQRLQAMREELAAKLPQSACDKV